MTYRSEIDGLRAVAVLSVVLYHAGIDLFQGGFVGVDIFFVISGYLITSILLKELKQGEFSLAAFYERRARRILPALFLVILCCLPFAWMWMAPDQLLLFGRSVVAVVLSVSNFLFWREEGGYFTAAAELKPLLHTWSLGVEEQYYVFAPLALALFWRYGRRTAFWVTVATAAASLAATEWGWRFAPIANFYLPPFRIWELLAGAICGFLLAERTPHASNVLSLAGLGLILVSIFAFSETVPFPSLMALVPVGGAALIVLFAAPGTWVAQALSLPPMVGIGLISYSAYLWHQPLFAFMRIRSMAVQPEWVFLLLAVAAFGLGYLSWRFVEVPFRRKRGRLLPRRRTLFAGCGAMAVLLLAFGSYASLSRGIPWRVETPAEGSNEARWLASIARISHAEACWLRVDERFGPDRNLLCEVFNPPQPEHRILVIGDSHSRAILDAFAELGKRNTVYWIGAGGCPPILGVKMSGTPMASGVCEEVARREYEAARSGAFDMVVLVTRWSDYSHGRSRGGKDRFGLTLDDPADAAKGPLSTGEAFAAGMRKTVEAYADLGLAVVLVDQVPEQPALPDKIVQQVAFLDGGMSGEEFEAVVRQSATNITDDSALRGFAQSVLRGLAGDRVSFLSLQDLFEQNGKFIWGDRDGSYYSDGNHLSVYGDKFIASEVTDHIGKIFSGMAQNKTVPARL